MRRSSFDPELFTWQWGLIPWFAKEPKLKYPTNNCLLYTSDAADE